MCRRYHFSSDVLNIFTATPFKCIPIHEEASPCSHSTGTSQPYKNVIGFYRCARNSFCGSSVRVTRQLHWARFARWAKLSSAVYLEQGIAPTLSGGFCSVGYGSHVEGVCYSLDTAQLQRSRAVLLIEISQIRLTLFLTQTRSKLGEAVFVRESIQRLSIPFENLRDRCTMKNNSFSRRTTCR